MRQTEEPLLFVHVNDFDAAVAALPMETLKPAMLAGL